MSLSKQLLIIISALFLMIFSVNFAISVNNIRSYLQGESEIHAQDTATSLGLSLSPYMVDEADPVIETMMNAIFDMGYYKEIKLVNIDGKPLVTLTNDKVFEEVPDWFVDFLPMRAAVAESEVSSGWNITGVISVAVNPGYAYLKLYEQAKSGFYYSLAAFVFSILLLFVVLRFTLFSIKKIEQMALGISEGRFQVIEQLPWTTEVRNVTTSMNTMSRKIEETLKRLQTKLDSIGIKLQQDDLTGLHKKSSFNTDMKQLFMANVEAYIFIIKIDSLASLVKEQGSDSIDLLLKDFAQTLTKVTNASGEKDIGIYRFFGSEFAILLQNVNIDVAEQLAKDLSASFAELGKKYHKPDIAHIGVTSFNPVGTTESILAAANEAYEQAQIIRENSYFIRAQENQAKDIAEWKSLVFSVIDNKQYKISFVNQVETLQTGQVLMEDSFTQVYDNNGGSISIGTFVSIAEKFAKIVDLDKGVTEQVIHLIKDMQIQYAVAISLSTRTIKSSDFRSWLENAIKQNQSISHQLVFSFSAYAVTKEVDVYKEFIKFIHNLNAKVIIKRFESHTMSTTIAKELNPDYIRLARDIGHDIASDESKKTFVATMQGIGNLLDITILAENVYAEQDFNTLKSIGIAGASR